MKTRKFLALLLTCMIASSALAACNSGSTGSSSGTESSGATSSEAESSGEESGSTTAGLTSDVVNGETNQQTYPLTEETVTLLLVSQRRQYGGTGGLQRLLLL